MQNQMIGTQTVRVKGTNTGNTIDVDMNEATGQCRLILDGRELSAVHASIQAAYIEAIRLLNLGGKTVSLEVLVASNMMSPPAIESIFRYAGVNVTSTQEF